MKKFLEFVKTAGTDQKAADLLGLSDVSITRKRNGKQGVTRQDRMLIQLPVKTLEKISKKAKKS